ncbi:MAG TPA: ComEC/Rec2 family competence protein [Candidatus Saccharimonadales bacterium]|nr:ComEC/Rec2 family competence protein [Candidatus Saccharimonadales bacterium]
MLGGLGLARRVNLQFEGWWLVFLPAVLLLKKRNIISLYLVIALGLSIGLARGGVYMQHVHQLQSLALQKVTIVATAASDSIYGNNSQVQFTGNDIEMPQPYKSQLAGTFKLSGFGEKMIYRGDRVQVTGKLYPSRGSNQATIAYAQLSRLSEGHSVFDDLSRRFSAGMQSALPEPMASFGLGLLVGQRNTLPADITAALTAVGLVHIVAVSGYNLTIIVRGVGRLKLGSRYQKLAVSLGLILAFVLITGFSASIIRAALVSVLSLWAWYYGRQIKPMLLISFAAAVTAMWNPFYVWGDLSWYLSFLAFFGILVIGPIIQARLFRRAPRMLTAVLLETLSAELMTLPLIMMTFSQLSVVSLAANILVVPLVPLAMLLSAVAAGAGMLIPQFAGWFALPARLLLTYMLDIVHLLADIPSALTRVGLNPEMMVIAYVVIAVLVITLRRRPKVQIDSTKTELEAITP